MGSFFKKYLIIYIMMIIYISSCSTTKGFIPPNILEKNVQSVVHLKLSGIGAGSGFIVEQNDKYFIITCAHVQEYSGDWSAYTSNKEAITHLRRISYDEELDIAILLIEDDYKPSNPLKLGDSDKLQLGEAVCAIGNPSHGLPFCVSCGVVSSWESGENGLIQTDATINPGNSGGPLINSNGEVIGLVFSKIDTEENPLFEGIGFAVPSNAIKRRLEKCAKYD